MHDTGDGSQINAIADSGPVTYAGWCGGGCNPAGAVPFALHVEAARGALRGIADDRRQRPRLRGAPRERDRAAAIHERQLAIEIVELTFGGRDIEMADGKTDAAMRLVQRVGALRRRRKAQRKQQRQHQRRRAGDQRKLYSVKRCVRSLPHTPW